MRRPALYFAILWVIGILIAHYFTFTIQPLLYSLSILILSIPFLFILKKYYSQNYKWEYLISFIASLAIILSAILRYETTTTLFPTNHISNILPINDTVTLIGKIITVPDVRYKRITQDDKQVRIGRTSFVLESIYIIKTKNSNNLITNDSLAVTGKVKVTLGWEDSTCQYGDIISLIGKLRIPSPARNPGAFDNQKYLHQKGIFATISVHNKNNLIYHNVNKADLFTGKVIIPIKRLFISIIDKTLSGNSSGFLKGVIFGDTAELSSESESEGEESLMLAFRKTGTVHILAVSGSNVALIILILAYLLPVFRIPQRLSYPITFIAIILYMYLTDLQPSVIRAGIMVMAFLLAQMSENKSDTYNIISASAISILLWQPQMLFDVGFLLSFSATFFIFFIYRQTESFLPYLFHTPKAKSSKNKILFLVHSLWSEAILKPLIVSLSAIIGTTPIIAYYFNQFSIISPVANLIVVPLVSIITLLGFAMLIVGLIPFPLVFLLSATNWLLMQMLFWSVRDIADNPAVQINVGTPLIITIILYYCLITIPFFIKNLRIRYTVVIVLVLSLLSTFLYQIISPLFSNKLKIVMFDVHQGESIFIKFPKGKIMLIDGGDKNERLDYGEKVIAPFLRRNGISKIDAVVLTSPRREHLGGLLYIVDNFKIGRIITGKIDYFPTSEYSSFLEKVRWSDIPNRIVNENDTISIGDKNVSIKIVHSLQISQSKDYIRVSPLVMKVSYNKFSILLTSHIRGKDELMLTKKYGTDLSSTVLKIPHYGSADVCNDDFLQCVQPKISILSVGRGNKEKYPFEKTIERCKRWSEVYRTDVNGAISIETDGEKWSIKPMIKEWEF